MTLSGPASLSSRFRLSLVLSVQQASFNAVALKGDLAANLSRIACWGYDGAELAIRDPRLVDAGELVSLVAQSGLQVPAIGTGQAWGEEHLSLTDPDPEVRWAMIERVRSHVPLASRFGAAIIVGLIRGVVAPGVTREQAMAWLVDGLRESCAAAGEGGVQIALEPINRYETALINTVAQGLELIDCVGAPNLGLLIDTFHMNIEEPSIEESIAAAEGHISHFHVADSNRWHPGAGHLDFATLLSALKKTGYTGWVSGEFMPVPDADTAGLAAIQHLRSL